MLKHRHAPQLNRVKTVPPRNAASRPLLHAACAVLAALVLAGCAPSRAPVDPAGAAGAGIAGAPDARIWGDAAAEQILTFTQGRGITPGNACHAVAPTMLALSGGAENGAFGAGYLVGWSAEGSRPDFDVVTGVSTGALIAPLAFLGPEADDALRAAYTQTRRSDIFVGRLFPFSLLSDGLVGSGPLRSRIERIVTPEMIRRIAAEHAKGRRLFISTTNLDAQRPVIWNIGAIASQSAAPDAELLIEQLILASASIPGVFPPVMIDAVLPDGDTIREMHVDGAATSNILAAPLSLIDYAEGSHCPHPLRLFALVNGRLSPEFAVVKGDVMSIAERGLATVLKSFSNHSLVAARALDDRGVIDLREISISTDFAEPTPQEPFDSGYMQRLFRYGVDRGRRAE